MTGPEQLPLDHFDPDAMDDRAARLRAELDALDTAKERAKLDALDAIRRDSLALKVAGDRLDESVAEARGFGATWKQVAEAAGVTASWAWEKWAHRV